MKKTIDKNTEQYQEYKQAIATELAKPPLLQNVALLEKLQSFVQEFETLERIADEKIKRAKLKNVHAKKIAALYDDFEEVIKPLMLLHMALVECDDDLLVTTAGQLEEIQAFIYAQQRGAK